VLTLLEKLYPPREAESRKALRKFLDSITSGLEAEITITGKNERNWVQVEVQGPDAKVATNYLRKKIGVATSLEEIVLPMTLRGKIVDSGRVGYGLYVDISLNNNGVIDILVPLHKLRSHLVDGSKLPLREIGRLFCLYDNFPFSVRLTKVEVEGKKVWGEPSDTQVEFFRKWVSAGLDRVIILGASDERVAYAIERSGIRRDIVAVDILGFLEHSLCCKLGTDAPGIIKLLGTYLPRVPLCAFSPRKIREAMGTLPSS